MNSQDQTLEESNNEQSEIESSEEQKETSHQFEVNWQKLSWDQLVKNYKSLQAEYTRKTQELSKTKKESEISDEDRRAIDFLRANNFLTVEDLEEYSSKVKKDARITELIADNPELKTYEWAIKELSKSSWLAPEDVIEQYGFKSRDKLSKAKAQWEVKWTPQTKTKSIKDMSLDDYEQWRKSQGIGTRGTFS